MPLLSPSGQRGDTLIEMTQRDVKHNEKQTKDGSLYKVAEKQLQKHISF